MKVEGRWALANKVKGKMWRFRSKKDYSTEKDETS
jgi:hypothetical protein